MPMRPAPTKFGAGVRLTATVLIAVHVLLSAWLVVQFEGRYTEGAPSPSNIKAGLKFRRITVFLTRLYPRFEY